MCTSLSAADVDLWVEGVALAIYSHGVGLWRGAIRRSTLPCQHQQVALLHAAAYKRGAAMGAASKGVSLHCHVHTAAGQVNAGAIAAAASSCSSTALVQQPTRRRGPFQSATAVAPLRRCRSPTPEWPSALTPSRCRQPGLCRQTLFDTTAVAASSQLICSVMLSCEPRMCSYLQRYRSVSAWRQTVS
jgi:hypothetical protein